MRPMGVVLLLLLIFLTYSNSLVFAGESVFSGESASIFIVLMENKNYREIAHNPDAPYFNRLSGGRLTNYWGLAHPSLPNYVGMMGAWTPLPVSDDPKIRIPGDSLPEEMVRHHLTAGSYAQGLPQKGYGGSRYPRFFGLYVLKHDPFLLFARLRKSSVRDHVVPLSHLQEDLAKGHVPDLSLIVPDLCHDMHGAFACHFHNHQELIRAGDRFLARWIPTITRSAYFKNHRVWIFVVWDESSGGEVDHEKKMGSGVGAEARVHGGGRVPFLWIDSRNPHPWNSECFANHYSLLETMTRNFHIPSLAPPGERVPLPTHKKDCGRNHHKG